jgi:hypothetical protein
VGSFTRVLRQIAASRDERSDTGRVLWRTRLGQGVDAGTDAGGLIWTRTSGQVHDRLTALEPDDVQLVALRIADGAAADPARQSVPTRTRDLIARRSSIAA